ncbi:MAG: GtrA family protein [Xanthobacteraceae bacterium]|jgi:putative flippase GtrA
MRVSIAELAAASAATASDRDPIRKRLESWPRPVRFLAVGGLGLITDLAVFTFLIAQGPHPLLVRLVSLAAATLVTWRLNRALTFDRSGRHPADEAMRYAIVAGCAQAMSYAVFALLVLTVPDLTPQLAVLIGAAFGALVSYTGQSLFAFRPRRSGGDAA